MARIDARFHQFFDRCVDELRQVFFAHRRDHVLASARIVGSGCRFEIDWTYLHRLKAEAVQNRLHRFIARARPYDSAVQSTIRAAFTDCFD
ncbi:MAG: hypothetical protein AAGM38_11575, partial [Pseudomonadota bacterium]